MYNFKFKGIDNMFSDKSKRIAMPRFRQKSHSKDEKFLNELRKSNDSPFFSPKKNSHKATNRLNRYPSKIANLNLIQLNKSPSNYLKTRKSSNLEDYLNLTGERPSQTIKVKVILC